MTPEVLLTAGPSSSSRTLGAWAVLVALVVGLWPTAAQAQQPPVSALEVAKVSNDTVADDSSIHDLAKPEAEPTETDGGDAVVVDGSDGHAVDSAAIEAHRSPVQALNEHFLGSASRAVRFDWRASPVAFGLLGSEVLERNNFGQWRVGALGRKAFGDLLVEGAVNGYFAYATPSSETLALTPFRQAGRPNHFELDINVGYAVAEGVVTPLAAFMPPAEVALVAWAGARYLIYTQTFVDRQLTDIGIDLVSPQLSVAEQTRIERDALGSMLVDPARIHTNLGLSLDVYFQPGVFVSPRGMVTIPLLQPVTATSLGLFWELGLVLGYAL